jgi:hypothetical protein
MDRLTDRSGRGLQPGDAVLIGGGVHVGQVAEVVGWGGRRGVELVVHGARPAFLALPPTLVELAGVALLEPILPRGPTRPVRSAPAGGGWQATDRAVGEPESADPGAGGTGGGWVARRHDQRSRARAPAGPDRGPQAGVPQADQVPAERRCGSGPLGDPDDPARAGGALGGSGWSRRQVR